MWSRKFEMKKGHGLGGRWPFESRWEDLVCFASTVYNTFNGEQRNEKALSHVNGKTSINWPGCMLETKIESRAHFQQPVGQLMGATLEGHFSQQVFLRHQVYEEQTTGTPRHSTPKLAFSLSKHTRRHPKNQRVHEGGLKELFSHVVEWKSMSMASDYSRKMYISQFQHDVRSAYIEFSTFWFHGKVSTVAFDWQNNDFDVHVKVKVHGWSESSHT